MTRVEKTERAEIEKNDRGQEKGLLEKLGKFACYTTPAMKGLLFYGEGKRHYAAS
jgi:hypothetical protein